MGQPHFKPQETITNRKKPQETIEKPQKAIEKPQKPIEKPQKPIEKPQETILAEKPKHVTLNA
jgi:hypothetical protein